MVVVIIEIKQLPKYISREFGKGLIKFHSDQLVGAKPLTLTWGMEMDAFLLFPKRIY